MAAQTRNQACCFCYEIYFVNSIKSLNETRCWFTEDSPTRNEWINLISIILVMERITFRQKSQADSFEEYWSKWLNYIQSCPPPFFFIYLFIFVFPTVVLLLNCSVVSLV